MLRSRPHTALPITTLGDHRCPPDGSRRVLCPDLVTIRDLARGFTDLVREMVAADLVQIQREHAASGRLGAEAAE